MITGFTNPTAPETRKGPGVFLFFVSNRQIIGITRFNRVISPHMTFAGSDNCAMTFIARLSKLFSGAAPSSAVPLVSSAHGKGKPRLDLADVPKYPPYHPGLPSVSPEQIVETQHEMIERLRSAVAVSDADFDRTYLSAIHSYAAFVHLLPASETHHHRGTGGLFRHGLEAGLYGAMHADRLLFVLDEPPARRRVLEPIWRFAAFLAALNHDIGKPLSDVAVMDRTGELTWNPFACSLFQWSEQNGIDHYVIRFRPGRHQDHEMIGMLALEQVLSSGVKQYLADAGPKLLRWMVAAIANAQGAESINPFRDLVIRADRDSTERDLRVNGAMQSNMPSVGIASERFVLDAMRRLVRNRSWTVNRKGARVWIIEGNLYVSWNAARDIVRLITEDKTPGVPRDPDSIADMLIERGLAVARESFHGPRRYWNVAPEVLEGVILKSLRLSSPDLLLDPSPGNVAGRVLTDEAEASDEETEAGDGDPSKDGRGKAAHDAKTATDSARLEAPVNKAETKSPHGQKKTGKDPAADAAPPIVPSAPPPAPALGGAPVPEKPRFEQASSSSPHAQIAPHAEAATTQSAPTPQPLPAAAPTSVLNPFEGKGLVSEIVATLIADIRSGKRAPETVRQESGMVVLAWPEAFQGFGMEPRAALKTFDGAGLVDADPSMPTRLVRDGPEETKIVVIKHREGQALLAMIATPGAAQDRPPAPRQERQPQHSAGKANPSTPLKANAQPNRAATSARPLPPGATEPSDKASRPGAGEARNPIRDGGGKAKPETEVQANVPSEADGDLVDNFIRFYQDPGSAPPFPVVQVDGGLSLPYNMAAAHFARVAGATPSVVKNALIADGTSPHPRTTIAIVRNSQRIEISAGDRHG